MRTKHAESPEPRIYVACLAAYNNAKLHGAWIDALIGVDDVREAIAEILRTSPEPGAEEFAIHDYEGFGSAPIGEYERIEDVVELAELIGRHGALGAELVAHCGSVEEAQAILGERYIGAFGSVAEFAEDLLDQQGVLSSVPEGLLPYIDFEAYGRDLELGGDVDSVELGGQMHLWWTR